MAFQPTDIRELARLANIALTEEEQISFAKQFDDLFRFFDCITEAEGCSENQTEGISVLREDHACVDETRDALLGCAKTTADGCITVPLVMEDL